MENLLAKTKILDFFDESIQKLIEDRGWQGLAQKEQILSIYNFVKDKIRFGYNASDDIAASRVLADGYGQCNTKGSLFMALLRAVGIPCRIHGFYIDKHMQKGAMTGLFYKMAPQEIIHSWVEVYYNETWLNLEGFILDSAYLNRLQGRFSDCNTSFCGYGVATDNFKNPPIEWAENDTYIQKRGITKDLGIFDSPDDFYAKHSQKIGAFKRFLYKNLVRHSMNKNVARIRSGK